jgi:glycine cleavage system aminomethyltransferase T/glycine/D-amino acid oxidase-like deaminating enzyme
MIRQQLTKTIASASFPSTITAGRIRFSHPQQAFSSSSQLDSVPDHANVVIVGGGIIGTSVAYHLGKLGVKDVVLIERDRLTSGTTWHAAGLITTFGSMSSHSVDMRLYTRELYRNVLPEETGLETGMMDVGVIELVAENPNNPKEGRERLHYLRRVTAFNRLYGVNVKEIPPEEVKERFPLCNTDGVLAGFYIPEDGRVNPTDVTMAFAKGARQLGVKIVEGVSVKEVKTSNPVTSGRPRAVEGIKIADTATETGQTQSHEKEMTANVVVNSAGMWARQFGELCGVTIPNQAAEHYYLITEPISGLNPLWPVVEDPSRCIYMRPEGNGLMVGFFEWEGAPWNPKAIPDTFSFGQIEPDWDRMEPYLVSAMARLVPEVQNVGIKSFFCGPESFTPDNSPIVGPANLKNYYVAAGLNSVGILTGGGIGKTLAQWIKNDGISPGDIDVTSIHVNRFHKYQSNEGYRGKRVSEALGNTYRLQYPDHQPKTCRGARKSILHTYLQNRNAYFRDVSGWESPGWYAPSKDSLRGNETFGRPHYFSFWEAEHKACRENVALFDLSFMSKILVQGFDAGKFLNWLSTANVDGPVNQITYTQWLNEKGYLEADLTVTKLSETDFLVIATDTMHHHVMQHMASRLSRDWHVTLADVTSSYTQINLQGPRSRELLQRLTTRDLFNDFDFRRAEEIDIGDLARALCVRITYVGELGYELFIPTDQAALVYHHIVEAGNDLGLVHAGLKAVGSLRLEKGYRDYGHDIDNTDTILEAGLSFTIDWEKVGGFIGMDHVRAQKDLLKILGGRTRRMANVLVPLSSEDPLLYHGEVLWRNGERISDLRAASYGHSVGGGVGLTMLQSPDGTTPITKSWIDDASWEVEVADKFYPCQISLVPFYDPKNKRIK